jgi:hypothetical protein
MPANTSPEEPTVRHFAARPIAVATVCLMAHGLQGCATPKPGGDPSPRSPSDAATALIGAAADGVRIAVDIFGGKRDVSRLRDPALRRIFASDRASGQDLYETLTQVRAEMQQRKTVRSWVAATTAVEDLAGRVFQGGNLTHVLLDRATQATIDFAVNELRSRALSFGYQALDQHFTRLLGEDMRGVLSQVTVALPNPSGLDDADARRLLTMATMVAAAQVTERVLDDAERDFKALAPDYKNLLEQREKAAEVLFRVIDGRRAAQRSANGNERRRLEQQMLTRGALTAEDLRYIDTALNRMTLSEFVDDMDAQTLALRYLRGVNPQAFEGYAVQRDKVVAKTNAVLKAVSGVGAFAGFSALFADSALEQLRKRGAESALFTTAPVFLTFLKATVPVVQRAGSVAANGVPFPSLLARHDLFSVRRAGQAEQAARSASEVFQAVHDAGATDLFTGVFFREDGMGWLNGVHRCDATEAGRLVDAAVPRADRSTFATKYFGPAAQGFAGEYTFVNAFTSPSLGDREARLADQLLGRDHSKHTTDPALTAVQRGVRSNYAQWSNQQLLRLIFANRDASFAHANLDLVRIAIRPKPSAEAVYVFESYVNACAVRNAARQAPGAAAGGRAATPRQPPAGKARKPSTASR